MLEIAQTKSTKDILVVQSRRQGIRKDHEQGLIKKYAPTEKLGFISTLDNSDPRWENLDNLLEGVKLIHLTGSSDVGPTSADNEEKTLFESRAYALTRLALEKQIYIIGTCLGLQIVIQVLGGAIERIEEKKESGPVTVRVTDEGKTHPWITPPDKFHAMSSHQASVTALPEDAGIVVLGETEKDPYAMLGIKNKDGKYVGLLTSFHPELTEEEFNIAIDLAGPEYTTNHTPDKPVDTQHAEKILIDSYSKCLS